MKNQTTPLQDYHVARAYADCHGDESFEMTKHIRNLDFRCPRLYSRDQAIELMKQYCPNGYNEFEADLLKHLPEDCNVRIAREGSVCMYVETQELLPDTLASKMLFDEFELLQTVGTRYVYRLWWD